MFGINIITKTGILVFSHSFSGDFLSKIDTDVDIQAGLITAVLGALKEARGESVTVIRYREYRLLLYEGVLTNGILFGFEGHNPKLQDFLRNIVLKFELQFTYELYKQTVINRADFESFRETVRNQYTDMIAIDVSSLDRLIKIMNDSSTANNYIIYETKLLLPIFTKIVIPNITPHLPQITRIYREILNLESKLNQEHATSTINFKDIELYAIKTSTHCVVLFYNPKQMDRNIFRKELRQIQRKIRDNKA
ncbi:MAG: hypothetical protein ACFFB5_15320 [Promethearchaeota archaeon]